MAKGATSGTASQNVDARPTPGGVRNAALGRPAGAAARRRRPAGTATQSQQQTAAESGFSQRETIRFYTDDAPGLKIGPTMVLVLSLLFIGFVVLMHIYGKMTSS
mmetsp:Transcript_16976/g.43051  ORF Transcript_16976/g.43051 Transcript_16976/m.43051 type:complete len:105 (+) Transcript_16976:106-420(+)